MSRRLPYVPAIVLTVFLDILAFGMFIPDIQLRGELLVHALPISADATVLGVAVGKVLPGSLIGLLLALFSIAQLGEASVRGRLSGWVGRGRGVRHGGGRGERQARRVMEAGLVEGAVRGALRAGPDGGR